MKAIVKRAAAVMLCLLLAMSMTACGSATDIEEVADTIEDVDVVINDSTSDDTTEPSTDDQTDDTTEPTTAPGAVANSQAIQTMDDPASNISTYDGIVRDEEKGCFFNDTPPVLTEEGLSGSMKEAMYTEDGAIIAVFFVGNGTENDYQLNAIDAAITNGAGETVAAEYLAGSAIQIPAGEFVEIVAMIQPENVLLADDSLSALGVNMAFDAMQVVTSVEATHQATITVKDHGVIKVALDAQTAPITVENFKALADKGFYDGLTFHRIIAGFMMQGGDPNGNGTGGSDEEITGEFAQNGIANPLSHVRGAISMARSSDPNSASSQFFIVHQDSTYLDGQYAVFGYVTEGMEIVDAICTAAKPIDDNGTIPAEAQPIIQSIVVSEV